MRVRRWWLAVALAAGSLASPLLAQPGTLITRDNHTLLGDITEAMVPVEVVQNGVATTELRDSVIIVLHGIASRYDRSDIAQVIYNGTVDDQFHARLRKLDPLEIRGRIELAGWASQQQRPDLAVLALQQARDIDPTNRDAALALQSAQRQEDLDALRHPPSTAPAVLSRGATPGATSGEATSAPTSAPTSAAALPPPAYRLLTDDEVNRLRQKELGPDTHGVIFEFRDDLARRYLAKSQQNPKTFRSLSLAAQARLILADGNPQDAQDLRLKTDPPALLNFRQHLMPVIATACGSTACHGGGTRGGSFELFTGDAPNTVYTNFYILQNYATTIDGVEYRLIDRTLPPRSLLLQFGLPADQAEIRHPSVPEFRARFRTRSDPIYQRMLDWISNELAPIQPDYQLRVLAQPPTTMSSLPPSE